jgi:hypothetical protein
MRGRIFAALLLAGFLAALWAPAPAEAAGLKPYEHEAFTRSLKAGGTVVVAANW